MFIAIKSEMDSRPLLYPLMRSLFNYGSILVLTNNKILRRLIDNPIDSGFRNITILIDESSSADEICENYGVAIGDYDFVILDNLGSSEYDVCFVALGSLSSQDFEAEIELLFTDDKVKSCIVQFGQVASKQQKSSKEKVVKEQQKKESSIERKERLKREKEEKVARKAAEREAKKNKSEKRKSNETLENYDPASKFRDLVKPNITKPKSINVPFPNFQEIETLEAEHRFPEVNRLLAEAIYDLLKDVLAVERIQFQKEMRKKDESSGYIKSSTMW